MYPPRPGSAVSPLDHQFLTLPFMLHSFLASSRYISYLVSSYIRPTDNSFDTLLLQDSLERLLRLAKGGYLCHKSGEMHTARRKKRSCQLVISWAITKTASENCLLVADQTDRNIMFD